jgi:hypothetical protein
MSVDRRADLTPRALRGFQARVRAVNWDMCIVLNEQRVVLGRLGVE